MKKSSLLLTSLSVEDLSTFRKLRNFDGAPPAFWKLYLSTLVRSTDSKAGILALSTSPDAKIWQPVSYWPDTSPNNAYIQQLLTELKDNGVILSEDTVQYVNRENIDFIIVNIAIAEAGTKCVALLNYSESRKEPSQEITPVLEFLHDIPAIYQIRKNAQESTIKQNQFASVLDFLVLLNEKDRFLSASMTLCNELASRYHCDRVSLGWLKNKYVKLQTMSHSDDFNRKMEAVKKLELAMEEALEQNIEIILPGPENNKSITRDHEQFVQAQDVNYICSLPMRIKDEPLAVCTLERNATPFSSTELQLLNLTCDQSVKRLNTLKSSDRWFGAIITDTIWKFLKKAVGYQHTGVKLIGILVFTLLCILTFVPVTYRLESPVILRTDNLAYLTAPFNSHIDRVFAIVGEEVKTGQELLLLDKNELILEEARLEAERNRYQRESEKARATDQLADMQIAEALKNQALSQLELVQFRLNQASITAPFNGIIVEGDQMERLGAPAEQGDVLFKIARIDQMYAEIEVPESEIHNVATGLTGDIALASKPQNTFSFNLFRVEPSAVVKEKGNVFIVHGSFNGDIPEWWRPGMTGVAKINAGTRTLLWILTHRTVDFLRLRFWW